jgi:hypothetical protein
MSPNTWVCHSQGVMMILMGELAMTVLQYWQHFFNTSVQPSTTRLAPPQIFLGGKVHISCIDCNFHFWWVVAVQCFKS